MVSERALIIFPANPKILRKLELPFSEEEIFELYKGTLHDTAEYYVQKDRNVDIYIHFPDYETYNLLVQIFPLRVRISIMKSGKIPYFDSVRNVFMNENKFVVVLDFRSVMYPIPFINSTYNALTHKYDVIVLSQPDDYGSRLVGIKKLHERFLRKLESRRDEIEILKAISELDVLVVPLRKIAGVRNLESLAQFQKALSGIDDSYEFKRTRKYLKHLLKKYKLFSEE
jgi:hypothetical protein